MKRFFKEKLADPLTGFLKQGISPSGLSWAVSLGIIIATIPVFGSCTLLCLLAIWAFRLNPGAVLLVNQLAYPLQFLLYFPLIRAGAWLFNKEPLPFSIPDISRMFRENLPHAISVLGWSTLYGLTVWIILAVPVSGGLYILFKAVFAKVLRNGKD